MRMVLVAFALGGALACAAAPLWAETAGFAVHIDNFVFEPERLVVKVGATVIWTNRDDIPHNVTAKDRSFKSKVMDTDKSFSFTFTTPGEYQYFCALHPHMTGTIVVETAAGGGPTQ